MIKTHIIYIILTSYCKITKNLPDFKSDRIISLQTFSLENYYGKMVAQYRNNFK